MYFLRKKAFTIIELLVVIVVIGIIASVIIVSFSGISQRASIASLQTDLSNSSKIIEIQKSSTDDLYPTSISGLGLKGSSGNSYTYIPSSNRDAFCLQTSSGGLIYSKNNKGYLGNGVCNIAPSPIDIFAWVQTANNATLSRDSTAGSPVGNNALKMTITGADPYTNSWWDPPYNLAYAQQGETWTMSVYVKANQNMSAQLYLFETTATSGFINAYATNVNINTNWQRISLTATFTGASTTRVRMRLDGPDAFTAGNIVWFDGLQLEKASSASTLNATYTL